jgi:hypothetical protein
MDLAKNTPPTLTMRNDGEDTFVVADGVTIASQAGAQAAAIGDTEQWSG